MGRRKKIDVSADEKKLPAKTKDIITSWILVTARYDFSVGEQRILLRIYERLQEMLANRVLKTEEFDEVFKTYSGVKMNFALTDIENNKHYTHLKEALNALHQRTIEFSTDKIKWAMIHLIDSPVIYKDGRYTFSINEHLVRLFCNFSQGWRRYNLQTALSFRNVAAARLYAMFNEQENTVRDYYIDDFKKMLGCEEKYPLTADFDRFILQPAQKELKQKSDWIFDYSFRKDPMNPRKFKVIHIRIKQNPKFITPAEMNEVENYLAEKKPSKYQQFIDMLQEQLGFSETDVKYTDDAILKFFNTCSAMDQDPISWLEGRFQYISDVKDTAFAVKFPKAFIKSCIMNYPSNSTTSLEIGPLETIRMFCAMLEKNFPKKYHFLRDHRDQIIGYELFTSVPKKQFEALQVKLLPFFDYDQNRMKDGLDSFKSMLELLWKKAKLG